MRNANCVFLVVLGLVLICGCDSSSSKNDLGYSEMNEGCDGVVSGFEACGGDVQGTWTFEGQCVDVDINIPEFEQLQKICPSFDMGVAGDMTGTVVIDATTIARNITGQTMVLRMFLPKTCMVGMSCSEMETDLKESMNEPGMETNVSCLGDSDCDCYVSMSFGGGIDSEEYTLEEIGEEHFMVIEDPEGDMYMPYCVAVNQVVIVETDEDEEMSGEIYMRLKK